MSSKARGLGEADLQGKPVELAMPAKLVQLAVDADRVLTYWSVGKPGNSLARRSRACQNP